MTCLDSLLLDARDAARTLGRRPGAAATAVAMLALGIGITTAMFTIVDALIIRPVPFHEPDELAFIYMGNDRGGRATVAPAVLRAWQESPAFAGAESAVPDTALVDVNRAVVARGIARVTPGLFPNSWVVFGQSAVACSIRPRFGPASTTAFCSQRTSGARCIRPIPQSSAARL